MCNLQEIIIINNIAYINGELEENDDFELPFANRMSPGAPGYDLETICVFCSFFKFCTENALTKMFEFRLFPDFSAKISLKF